MKTIKDYIVQEKLVLKKNLNKKPKFLETGEITNENSSEIINYVVNHIIPENKSNKCKIKIEYDKPKVKTYTIKNYDKTRKYFAVYEFGTDLITMSFNHSPHCFDEDIVVSKGKENLIISNNFCGSKHLNPYTYDEDIKNSIHNWMTGHGKTSANIFDLTNTDAEEFYDLCVKYITEKHS
jgi:hypothetical protein